MKRAWIPLVAGFVAVPALVTTLGFTVYGEELTEAFPSSRVTPVEVPRVPLNWAALEQKPPGPARPTPDALQRNVSEVFSAHGVKGITFAPGTSSLVGKGPEVQRAVGGVLRPVTDASVTLIAHAWNGETASHRCDVLAMHRAGLVREYLLAQGVPARSITTRVIVDPVWGPPSDGGPQVDIVVG